MKYVFFLACLFASLASAKAAVITFEELSTFTGNSSAGGGQYYNGNNGTNTTNSNGWSSQGVFFGNNYDSGFGGFWSGWSYSNVVNTTTAGFTNQYASYPGGGSNGVGGVAAGQKYAIAFASGAFFNLPTNSILNSVDLSNGTYAARTMQTGDTFSKKFGGVSGNDPDLFGVILRGYDSLGGTGNLLGSVTVNLADYRFTDNSQDYILNNWQTVGLSSIANARSVSLDFFSTDSGAFGINTPTYLALDNLAITAVPEPSIFALICVAGFALLTGFRKTRLKSSRLADALPCGPPRQPISSSLRLTRTPE